MSTHRPATSRRQSGFTLVEVLVVIVILGILGAVVAFGVARYRADAADTACAADVATVSRAAAAYEAATGSWPADLAALVSAGYLKSAPAGTYTFDSRARTVGRSPACTTGTAAHTGTAGAISGVGGKCVAVAGDSAADGAAVQLATCATGRSGQQFRMPGSYPGPIMVLGKCLGTAGGATANRTRVVLGTCDGSEGQRWALEASGDMLTNPRSGRCLDAENGTSTDGTLLIIWDCHGNANQRWTLP